MSCKIKRVDRGYDRPMLCLPGWATDWRIFHRLSSPHNIVSPRSFLPTRYHDILVRHLRNEVSGTIDVCGWSLGAYAAVRLAHAVPDSIRRLILVGVRPEYPEEEVQAVRQTLRDNTQRCLKRFYRQCFLPAQKSDYKHFRRERLRVYLRNMNRKELLEGLDYLSEQSFPPDEKPEYDIILIHGEDDVVVPVQTARDVATTMPTSELQVLPSTGHAAFMSPQFKKALTHD